jgi:hypothetical protein
MVLLVQTAVLLVVPEEIVPDRVLGHRHLLSLS